MKLRIYTDETLCTVREEREVPRMKIPYRTADAVADLVDGLDFDNINEHEVLSLLLKNKHHLTTVVRATFALSEEDLGCIDVMDLGDLAREIISHVIAKMAELGVGETAPNA